MKIAQVVDDRHCALGEGAFWHPKLDKLFWFDILDRQLLCDDGHCWQFGELVSAAGWINETSFLIAGQTGLSSYNFRTLTQTPLFDLEARNTITRSNDGRADPWGGFWIGTMGKKSELNAGAIYRLYKGEIRRIFVPVTIPNAICFAPDKSCAYFTDTPTAQVMRTALDANGWPTGTPDVFLDLRSEDLNPDGAIVTADGLFVNAQWGRGRIAVYTPQGELLRSFELPTDNVTCPALGGGKLYVTSAQEGLTDTQRSAQPMAGTTFVMDTDLVGQDEHQVIL